MTETQDTPTTDAPQAEEHRLAFDLTFTSKVDLPKGFVDRITKAASMLVMYLVQSNVEAWEGLDEETRSGLQRHLDGLCGCKDQGAHNADTHAREMLAATFGAKMPKVTS